ncbi:MAG: magnesium transporter, partial [Lachnospiraceae bacterium]|nr:magnesium transporter [Lachnospiraceae bacterium]
MEEIRELLGKGQYTRLRQIIKELNDADIADYLEEMEEEEVIKIFRILPKDKAADVFSYLEIDQQ